MNAMKKLIRSFKHKHPDYEIYLDELESTKGYYRICITEPVCKISTWYTFASCKSFKEWMDSAVIY